MTEESFCIKLLAQRELSKRQQYYCDMMPESRNSPLLGNGSPGTYSRQWRCYEIDTRFYGDADSWRQTWYGTRYPCQRNQIFPRIPTSNQHFSMKTEDYISGRTDKKEFNPCGGGVEYLHRDPASRRRRRKGKSQI
jgi:hypothetical protein